MHFWNKYISAGVFALFALFGFLVYHPKPALCLKLMIHEIFNQAEISGLCLFLHFLHFLDYHSEYFKELSLKMQMLAVKNSISRKLYVVKLSKSQIFFGIGKKSTSARKGIILCTNTKSGSCRHVKRTIATVLNCLILNGKPFTILSALLKESMR